MRFGVVVPNVMRLPKLGAEQNRMPSGLAKKLPTPKRVPGATMLGADTQSDTAMPPAGIDPLALPPNVTGVNVPGVNSTSAWIVAALLTPALSTLLAM